MKLKVVAHEAEEGGYWAEVPSIPGYATQGDSFDELLCNIYEAVKGCLSVDVQDIAVSNQSAHNNNTFAKFDFETFRISGILHDVCRRNLHVPYRTLR